MPRKKKSRTARKKAIKEGEGIFNPAFQDLSLKIKNYQKPVKRSDIKPPPKTEDTPDDNQCFLEAMSDVMPLKGGRIKITPNPGANIRPSHPAPDDEKETMSQLYGLVKGSIEMDITFSDEYMEGSVGGIDRKIMKRLQKGQFPVQDYIDLHGLTKEEAEVRVRDFLLQSHRLGLKCVLIVHGRGLNSPDSFPVLKERLPRWLGSGPVKKVVLAFATAMPYDGGTGAVYVLLRKR